MVFWRASGREKLEAATQCPATARCQAIKPTLQELQSRNDDKKRNTPSPKQTKTRNRRHLPEPPSHVRHPSHNYALHSPRPPTHSPPQHTRYVNAVTTPSELHSAPLPQD